MAQQPVALLVAVIMPAIASDMSGLLRRLTSFQNPQKSSWNHHCIVCVIAAVAYTKLQYSIRIDTADL